VYLPFSVRLSIHRQRLLNGPLGRYLIELEALGQCIPPPRHDLSASVSVPDPDHNQNLIFCLMAHCQPSWKISCKSVSKFLRKFANKQTDRQTNNGDYITFLVEVINELMLSAVWTRCHCQWLVINASASVHIIISRYNIHEMSIGNRWTSTNCLAVVMVSWQILSKSIDTRQLLQQRGLSMTTASNSVRCPYATWLSIERTWIHLALNIDAYSEERYIDYSSTSVSSACVAYQSPFCYIAIIYRRRKQIAFTVLIPCWHLPHLYCSPTDNLCSRSRYAHAIVY